MRELARYGKLSVLMRLVKGCNAGLEMWSLINRLETKEKIYRIH
jgi:hypothetical protein